MANPPRKKGTGGETELLGALGISGLTRTPASSTYDLRRPGGEQYEPIEVLATRPDRGQWLVTMRAADFRVLVDALDTVLVDQLDGPPIELRIEVKRYARFSLHSIFEGKFGGKRGPTR